MASSSTDPVQRFWSPGGKVVGVEPFEFDPPPGCPVLSYGGTLLPGLIDAHTHLVTDSRPMALDRVPGYSAEQIETVMAQALRDSSL